MKNHPFKKAVPRILALLLSSLLLVLFTGTVMADGAANDRFVTVTLHAGSNGYFGEPGVKEYATLQLHGSVFDEYTVPMSVDPFLVFAGWASTPDAEEADVFLEETPVDDLGTDLYAVWTDSIEITYDCTGGYILEEGEPSDSFTVVHRIGEHFHSIAPVPPREEFSFAGWYTDYNGFGTAYTEDTLVVGPAAVYACWQIIPEKIPAIASDTDYPVVVNEESMPYVSFTPTESGLYEAFTKDFQQLAESDEPLNAYVALLSENNLLLDYPEIDEERNARIFVELEAGHTYYFVLHDYYQYPVSLSFTVQIHKVDSVSVTFHANGPAYFDGDPSVTEKTIRFLPDRPISTFEEYGLRTDASSPLSFEGWALTPDGSVEYEIEAQDGLDLYAVFENLKVITFDANGGFFPQEGNATLYRSSYGNNEEFSTRWIPKCYDNTLAFLGWADRPDATVPNIVEGNLSVEMIPDVLYAVYSEKVVVTFDGNGGLISLLEEERYHLPVYITTVGKGRPFAPPSQISHIDENGDFDDYVSFGWKDQNGVTLPDTSGCNYEYRIEEDSCFTAVWARNIVVDANGGYFLYREDYNTYTNFPVGVAFSSQYIVNQYMAPQNADRSLVVAGYATTPDAEEPDIIEGETMNDDLPDTIYVVWKKSDNPGGSGNNPLRTLLAKLLKKQFKKTATDLGVRFGKIILKAKRQLISIFNAF